MVMAVKARTQGKTRIKGKRIDPHYSSCSPSFLIIYCLLFLDSLLNGNLFIKIGHFKRLNGSMNLRSVFVNVSAYSQVIRKVTSLDIKQLAFD